MHLPRTLVVLVLLAVSVTSLPGQAPSSPPIEIRLNPDTSTTRAARDQLLRILATWDLSRWIFTRTIQFEPGVIPHSHPVLTLNTSVATDSVKAKIFIHEQLHWFLSKHYPRTAAALVDLRHMYPDVPAEGADAKESMYLHTLLGVLELDALEALFGEPAARSLIGRTPFYQWEYRQVLDSTAAIRAILRTHDIDRPDARQ